MTANPATGRRVLPMVEPLEPRLLLDAVGPGLGWEAQAAAEVGQAKLTPAIQEDAGGAGLQGAKALPDKAGGLRANPAAFVDVIDNPYLPLLPGTRYVYKGTEDGEAIRNTVVVTRGTKQIQGVTTTVVRDRVYVGGELVEDTLDWYAQDGVGNVWYFGEDSKEYEDGKVVSTQGSWEAGVDGASAGIVMPAHPAVGSTYQQEFAPGEAEDQAKVLSLGSRAVVPYATFGGCLKTKDFTPLEPDQVEHKYYAPGIGFVRSVQVRGGNEVMELVRMTLAPDAFVDTIDNPYFPLIPGTKYVYKGMEDGEPIRNTVLVTGRTKQVQGVTTTVVRDRVYVDGELAEDTLDWYAQDAVGNVWYFGEDSKDYEDGKVVSTEGSWQAGVDGAMAGIAMPAYPRVGDTYYQEFARGEAEDQGRVLGLGSFVSVPFGNFGRCLKTRDFTALEPDQLENKFYAPGIGFVRSVQVAGGSAVMDLVRMFFP